jgi:hypothetical protein
VEAKDTDGIPTESPQNLNPIPSRNDTFIIMASHEGMLAAIWDNNHDKLDYFVQLEPATREQGQDSAQRGRKIHLDKEGTVCFGGWEPEGLEAYNTYYEKNCAARKLKKRKEVEKAMYDQLHSAMGILAPEHTTHIKGIC